MLEFRINKKGKGLIVEKGQLKKKKTKKKKPQL
jgi:hypothetical protein